MQVLVGETLDGRIDFAPGRVVEGREFRRCFFDNASCGRGSTPGSRLLLRNLVLRQCKQRASAIAGVVVEDVLVEGLGKEGRIPFLSWASVFKHVTLRGRVAALKVNSVYDPFDAGGARSWIDSARTFYSQVDWALDISEAEFQGSVNLEAIPGNLVRRDPSTQILVRRANAEQIDLSRLALPDGGVRVALEWFLADGPYDSVVIPASKKSKTLQRQLETFALLRGHGIADAH